jgi:hypothetical protein
MSQNRTKATAQGRAMHKFFFLLIACGPLVVNPRPALAGNIVVGVNVQGVQNMTDQQQDALIDQLQKNGVKTVRMGIGNRYNRFIIEAHRHGIGAVVFVFWPVWGITHADPNVFRASVTTQLAPVEAAGVPLTAFELGNEINSPFFNGDFLPGLATGRVLGLSDIDNPQDREGQAIAASYRAYVSLLAVLKDVRDHSKVNRKTPIITAGMADPGLPGKRPGQKFDVVSIPATYAFLRRNGVDKLVDGYGVHIYPSGDLHRSASTRTDDLKQDAFAPCSAAKPCWLTEWGWANPGQSCPLNDKTRAQLVQLERKAFDPFVKQEQLAAILMYFWSSLPGAKSEDPAAIFRCGALTDAGKLALSPM